MSFQIKLFQNPSEDSNVLEISNATTSAKIDLNKGASIQSLTLDSVPIIKELSSLISENTFASSILFPFANRIKGGKYIFNTRTYQTEINQVEENNALHGFVYDKEFQLVKQQTTNSNASVILEYNETEFTKGFPFTYKIQVEYTLTKHSLELKVRVENTSENEFPFTLGWHPYFYSADLNKSILKFKSSKQVVFDETMIPIGTCKITNSQNFELKNKKLDDCFYLDANLVEFVTPAYCFQLTSSEKENFLQIYTPKVKNTIAIEPTTGISNSFNTEIGLKKLLPKETYRVTWKLNLRDFFI